MPLIPGFQLLFTVLALAILGAAAWLLGDWYFGQWVRVDGDLVHVREAWRLWLGLGLLAWSFLGRPVVLALVARRDVVPRRATRRASRMIQSDTGSRLYVEDDGAVVGGGPTAVLTHGWGLDSTIWNTTRDRLGGSTRVIAWDLPGLGKSKGAGLAQVRLETMAADLRAVIERVGEPVVLVGHSIGGMTIQTLARDHPALFGSKVKGVLLFNTTWTNPLQTMILSPLAKTLRRPVIEPMLHLAIWLEPLVWLSMWQSYLSGSAHLANRLGFGASVTRSQLEHTTLLSTRNRPAVMARGNLAMFNWDAKDALKNVPCPVEVVAGGIDILTLPHAGKAIAESAGARLHLEPGANHMGFLEQGEAYTAILSAFLAKIQPPSARAVPPTAGLKVPNAEEAPEPADGWVPRVAT
ncbi:alpha/beta fold hydrolase [Brevundimonas sp. Root1279]|uniref:alpha/beta fold hydrolase n=1 Tax=Brevundimonas sp. Root1279 TaxID=1736443 RepID=UPI0006F73C12|nr:alpha/beta hydrolase [Brevundimonas sp. Root1279]KQW80746.1 hypothetical protein ASC65_12270 [Brevundimonas sp. Root1279]